MYCVKCGVELEEGTEKCPLCGTKIQNVDMIDDNKMSLKKNEYPTIKINLYEIRMKKIKKAIFLSFLTICMISIFEIYVQNIIMYGEMKWGYFAIPSVILFLLVTFILLNAYSFRQNLFILFLGLSLYFLFLDFHDSKISWSLRTAISIVLTLYILGIIFSYIIEENVPQFILGDPTRLCQILIYLLNIAV